MKETTLKRRRSLIRSDWYTIRYTMAFITDYRIGKVKISNKLKIENPQDTAAFLRGLAEKLLKLAGRIERWAE